MNADSYFEIGSSHLICQDYALSGNYKDLWYGIVSDGCSSAEYSEIGAQILCHVTKNFLQLYYDLFFNDTITADYIAGLLANSIRAKADEVRKVYPISRDALQATLLLAVMTPTKVFIIAWGDGVIVVSGTSGSVFVKEIDYPETNAPVYLMTDLDAYKKKFDLPEQQIKRIRNYNLWNHTEGAKQEILENVKLEDPFVTSFPIIQGSLVFLSTDGLTQYQDQNKKPVDSSLIIPSVLDYPNYNGQFVKRTMNFMKRDLARKNWSHADDIGIATIVV